MTMNSSNSKNVIVRDIEFVFDECARFDRELKFRLRSDPKDRPEIVPNSPEAMELFYRIPHPNTSWSFQVCGKEAFRKLERLAELAAYRAGISKRVSIKKVRDELGRIIVRKFQVENRPVNITNVERALSEAARRLSGARKDITHYVPCQLIEIASAESVVMGPVTFHSRAKFRRLLASSLWSDRHRFRKDTIAFRRIIEYYGAFSWIAEISLRGFEEDKSKETAEAAVRSAVDCLHLLLGYQNTHRLRVGGSTQSWEKRAGIRKVEGNLTWEVSSHSTTDAGSEEEWPRIFADAGYERALGLCGTALRSIVEPEIERPLSHRFLDAAQWFGEAVRETSKAAKVVKYVTALERILMTDEKADITTTVSSRAAAFCYAIPSKSSLNAWKSEAQRAYAIRSKLVHGSMSPEADEVHEGIRLAAKVSDASIHSVLAALGEEGLLAEKVSAKRLAKWFDGACKSAVEQAIAD